MSRKINRIIYWSPRILAIILIAFLTIFSFDVFSEDYTFWETVLAFLMHNIPVFILTIVLLISWRFEWVGSIVFGAAAIFYMFLSRNAEDQLWLALTFSLILAGPAIIIAVLFFVGWRQKKRNTAQ